MKGKGGRRPEAVEHIRDLTPDPQNRRAHNPRNIGMIAEALQKVGAARSIVIDETGQVLAGNGLIEAAAEVGITKVQVVDADGDTVIAVRRRGLSDEQKRHLAIADNRTAELAEWNTEQLAADAAAGLDLQPFFFDEELRQILDEQAKAGRTDPDEVPAERPTGIVAGDLFELGSHRLLCGDATASGDVARLWANLTADLIITDPPYGVAYQTKLSVEEAVARHRRTDGLELANDAMAPEATQALVASALRMAAASLKPGGAFYVCSPSGDMELRFRLALLDAGLVLRQAIVWVKDVFVMGRQDYHWRHETLLYGWKDGAGHHFVDDRTQDTVWEYARPKRSAEHPTMKPVELVARAVRNSSRSGEVVGDPFGGSGTTLIACEQLARRGVVMELDPSYCQVIIDRWEAFTGQQAVKVGEAIHA